LLLTNQSAASTIEEKGKQNKKTIER
jgi:hypothetical protein